jgi:hypothetical protein
MIGVLSMSELALRPAPSPSARMPPTACERLEAGSRSHWLRLRGRCRTSVGVVHRLAVASPTVFLLAGLSPLPSERIRPRDGRLSIMTSIKRDVAARGREEVARGSACRRLSPAVAGYRRPTAPEWPTIGCPKQRTGHRSARSSLRVSEAFARLGRLGCKFDEINRERRACD